MAPKVGMGVGLVAAALLAGEELAWPCSPPPPLPDAGGPGSFRASRTVLPSQTHVVPGNAIIRVSYRGRIDDVDDATAMGDVSVRYQGGGVFPMTQTVVRGVVDDPFVSDPDSFVDIELRATTPTSLSNVTIELLDRFQTVPCGYGGTAPPCELGAPKVFATFYFFNELTDKPVLDPTGGAVTHRGQYLEDHNTCTDEVCKGYFLEAFAWRPAYTVGLPVYYRVYRNGTEIIRWLESPELRGIVACQTCGYPGGFSQYRLLTEDMTIRAVDLAGNLSDDTVAVTGLSPCPRPADAGPQVIDARPPSPDAPPSSSATGGGGGCDVGGPAGPDAALLLGLLLAGRSARRRTVAKA